MSTTPTNEYVHANGLTLNLAESLHAERISQGFAVELVSSRDTRYPLRATVVVRENSWTPPDDRSQEIVFEGRPYRYRIERQDGGSGGELYTLYAWRPYADGYLLVTQAAQAEWPSSPDHSLAWQVMRSADEPRSALGMP